MWLFVHLHSKCCNMAEKAATAIGMPRNKYPGNTTSRMPRLIVVNDTSPCLMKLSCAFLLLWDCLVADLLSFKCSHPKIVGSLSEVLPTPELFEIANGSTLQLN